MIKNILFVGAEDPHDDILKTHAQYDRINSTLDKKSYWLHKFSLPQINRLLEQLRNQKVSILHFSGHGEIDGIVFLDPLASYYYSRKLSYDSFVQTVKSYQADENSPNLECIVLLACDSFKICDALSEHVFCVIGTSRKIEPDEATCFATNFYAELSRIGYLDVKRYNEALRYAETNLATSGDRSFIHSRFNEDLVHTLAFDSIDTPQNLPLSGVARLVGRADQLQTIHQHLQANSQVAILAISGMHGVGKTELAIQYGTYYRNNYRGGICWINSRGFDVGKQIVDFSTDQLKLQSDHVGNLDSRVQFCWNNWNRDGDVLIVFDDVTNYGKIKAFLPPRRSRFKVLVTTRKKMESPVLRIDLDVLTADDAVELLISLIGQERVAREIEATNELCLWVGFLPLALELIGRYLGRHKNLTIARIFEQLQHKDSLQHSSILKSTDEMTAVRGLSAALELSWDELDLKAQKLACLLSLFDVSTIPLSLVEKSINASELMLSEEGFSALGDLREDFANGVEQSSAMSDLVGLNLVKSIGENSYRLHELTQKFFYAKLNADNLPQFDDLPREFSAGMLSVAQEVFESSNYSMNEFKALMDFMLQVPTKGRADKPIVDFLELLFRHYGVQQYLYDNGYLESAILRLERAKQYLRELGKASNLKAQVLIHKMLGHAYYANPAQNRSLAIENMKTATDLAVCADKTPASPSDHKIWLWYQIFLLDHIHNLLSKPSDQPSPLGPRGLENQIARLLPTNLEQTDKPPQLSDLSLLLRAAHYWGHRGNQVSFRLESLLYDFTPTRDKKIESLISDGIRYYTLASVFRAANFHLSFPQQCQQHLVMILDDLPNIPRWFLTWKPPVNSLDFECFLSASQAAGDIAHQYRGMAVVQLYGYLYYSSKCLRSSLLDEANCVVKAADSLWAKAKILLTPGEQLIKYYAWMANLKVMLELCTKNESNAQLSSQADVEREVIQRLDELEGKYGLVYNWARDQAIIQINQFYGLISRSNSQ